MHLFKLNNFLKAFVGLALCALSISSIAEVEKGPAPNFTLKSLRGDNLKLSEHRGEVILINFWASWCGVCKQQFSKINEIYVRYRDEGFTVFAINVDKDREKVTTWLRGMGIAFPVLLDSDQAVSEKFQVEEMPSTYILDRDGNFRYVYTEYKPGMEDVLQKQIRELMEE